MILVDDSKVSIVPSRAKPLAIGDKVSYRHCRETQHIPDGQRNAVGIVEEFEQIDGENCVKVRWPEGFHSWVFKGWLIGGAS